MSQQKEDQLKKRNAELEKELSAKNRELQIEAALEKVRSSSLAMHKSREMQQVVNVLYEQLKELGLQMHAVAMSGVINAQSAYEVWVGGSTFSEPLVIPYTDSTQVQREYNEIIASRPELFSKTYSGDVMKEYFDFLMQENEFPDEIKILMLDCEAFSTTLTFAKNSGMQLVRYTDEAYTDAENKILVRFTNVFEQAYVRFMDLQKAEAQARESQIESALERVRARSMAMHLTDELSDVLCVLLEQFDFLGINPVLTHLTLFDEANEKFSIRLTTSPKKRILVEQIIDIHAVESWKASFENWKKGEPNTVDCIDYPPEVLPAVWEVLHEVMTALPKGHKINPKDFPNGLFTTQGRFKFGYLGFNHKRRATDEEKNIVSRFATEFGRVYQRFLDLQKAEAQAREAQIETALERVRSQSMGMQTSKDLSLVTTAMFEQLRLLGGDLFATGIVFCDKHKGHVEQWHSIPEAGMMSPFIVPIDLDYIHQFRYDQWKKETELFSVEIPSDFIEQHFQDIFNLPSAQKVLKDFEDQNTPMPGAPPWEIDYGASFKHGYLLVSSLQPFEEAEILPRFAKVFEQTYTRFLDLQKAEAQAREAQIEAALERIRSRSLAMHHSSELSSVVDTLLQEFTKLDFILTFCIINLINEQNRSNTVWAANPETGKDAESYFMKFEDYPFHHAMWNAWKAKDKRFVYILEGDEKKIYDEYLYSETEFSRFPKHVQEANKALDRYVAGFVFFEYSGLQTVSLNQISEEELIILERFGRVFEQSYTRFLDLQKAEAQAREAQIEAALERLRSKTMAMHNSQDVALTVSTLFDELTKLGLNPNARCGIGIFNDSPLMELWTASTDAKNVVSLNIGKLDMSQHPLLQGVREAWATNKEGFSYVLEGDDLTNYFKVLNDAPEYNFHIDLDALQSPVHHNDFTFSDGILYVFTNESLTTEIQSISKRFASVFGQTYRRYLDLQKAEAQVRKAQIENALEKVRSRSIAMQKSEELREVIQIIHDQLIVLNFEIEAAGFTLNYKQNNDWNIWMATKEASLPSLVHIPYFDHPQFRFYIDAKKKGVDFLANTLSFTEKNSLFEYMFQFMGEYPQAEKDKILSTPGIAISQVFMKNISLWVDNYEGIPYTDEENDILKRFAKVFEQAFVRFTDLEHAEAQARESKIQLSLERVRAKAMAMHNSDDLISTIRIFYEEFESLSHTPIIRCGAGLFRKETSIADITSISRSSKGELIEVQGMIDMKGHPLLKGVYDHYLKQEEYKHVLKGNEIKTYYQHMKGQIAIPDFPDDARQHALFPMFTEGSFYVFTEKLLIDEDLKTFRRFNSVLSLTYRRYNDLIKAEAQARESLIEASLERVRSRTLAMQNSEELAQTSVVVFQQLLELGIAPNRLFIGIIKDNGKKIDAWATNEDGSKLASQFSMQASDNKSIKKMLDGWKQKKKSLIIDLKGKELQEYFQYLNKDMEIPFIHGLEQKRRVQSIAYFSGGLIGMAAPEEQPEETITLLERFAAVFNLTYTRFNDLKVSEAQTKKAEQDLIEIKAARKKAEDALTELKATQSQLIQSEKMASLGELTAGIAHEIQNPLNFVNNFSEVSKELLDEMKEEMDLGNLEDVKEIMEDVIENLEKINHHGKRADAIVKGMLQHSRTSSNKKEPTDINALCDEYLRLSYHGLRAKDKSFNATMNTDFDTSIGNMNIVPQDIGRVILNLLTNAFYACNERNKSMITFQKSKNNGKLTYKPTVSISTKKIGNTIEIKVADNGNGIPQKVKDKIFQPFFTTKPTGEGTGLGLSLSYDIVKAHHGELLVETEDNIGTTFKIVLPVN